MDIDKLIERLKKASADGSWNTLADYAHKAATALSTLQAENEKLRAELEQKSKLIAQQAVELERRDKLLKEQEDELEQVRAERDAAVKTIFQWTGCPECKWWDSAGEWCEKHDREADGCGGCESPEWRGQKED